MNIKVATEIAEQLNMCNEEFGCDENCEFEDYSFCDDLNYDEYGDFRVENGATKAVLVFDAQDFVIKVPFNGEWDYYYRDEDDEDEDEDEYYDGDMRFNPFQYASDSEFSSNHWDYCAVEYNLTKFLQENGFGALVPEMEIVGKDNGFPIYAQEKVTSYYEGRNSFAPFKETKETLMTMDRKYNRVDTDWSAAVVEKFGLKFWTDFVDFVEENCDELFHDLHSGNIGYKNDGTPVILDLGGFND